MNCDRCGRKMLGFTVSIFNTQQICIGYGEGDSCYERERAHPDFPRAQRIEQEAVARGDYNFPGVGLPTDL